MAPNYRCRPEKDTSHTCHRCKLHFTCKREEGIYLLIEYNDLTKLNHKQGSKLARLDMAR